VLVPAWLKNRSSITNAGSNEPNVAIIRFFDFASGLLPIAMVHI